MSQIMSNYHNLEEISLNQIVTGLDNFLKTYSYQAEDVFPLSIDCLYKVISNQGTPHGILRNRCGKSYYINPNNQIIIAHSFRNSARLSFKNTSNLLFMFHDYFSAIGPILDKLANDLSKDKIINILHASKLIFTFDITAGIVTDLYKAP